MSITAFMYTGVSGLNSHSDAMSVISDNIANANTVGFKSSRANFSDVLGGVIGGDAVGAGSVISSVQNLFNQGSLLGTGNTTDLAIRGDGFFMVQAAGATAPLYTRAGQFHVDESGLLVDQLGNRVQGYGADATGTVNSVLGDVAIPSTSLPPVATSSVEIDGNLNAGAPIGPPFDITNPPSGDGTHTSNVTVYDSLGNAHQLEIHFTKVADAPSPQWEYNITAAGSDVTPAPAGDRELLGTGTLVFGVDGELTSQSLTSVTANWTGAAPGTIALDFGSPTSTGGDGLDGFRSYGNDSTTSFVNQDGNGSGDFGGIQISDTGLVTGLYSNGESRNLGQIALARFTATDGLQRLGSGMYAATSESGEAIVAAAGNGANGSIAAGALEASNVDLAGEFVNMITVQRGFQSNSRSITTADEMLSEVVSLKR